MSFPSQLDSVHIVSLSAHESTQIQIILMIVLRSMSEITDMANEIGREPYGYNALYSIRMRMLNRRWLSVPVLARARDDVDPRTTMTI